MSEFYNEHHTKRKPRAAFGKHLWSPPTFLAYTLTLAPLTHRICVVRSPYEVPLEEAPTPAIGSIKRMSGYRKPCSKRRLAPVEETGAQEGE
jgi:hypothetical protein